MYSFHRCLCSASYVTRPGPCGKVTQEHPLPHPLQQADTEGTSLSTAPPTPPPPHPRPLWKLQETAASTLIGLSGLADLQRAGESQHPYATAATLAWEWPWGRGQTAGMAVPGITLWAQGKSHSDALLLCSSLPSCPEGSILLWSPPGPPPGRAHSFLGQPVWQKPQASSSQNQHGRPHLSVQPRPGVQDCLHWGSTYHLPQAFGLSHTRLPGPVSSGSSRPRLWGCWAEGDGEKISARGTAGQSLINLP